jgi:hypothetical protein
MAILLDRGGSNNGVRWEVHISVDHDTSGKLTLELSVQPP